MEIKYSIHETKRWIGTLDKRMASASLYLETDEGKLLIIKANYKKYWTIPGGIIDPGETPLVAAIRETREEVGLEVAADDLQFALVANRMSDLAISYQFVFWTRLTSEMIDMITLQPSEITDWALVDKADIRRGERCYGKVIQHWCNDLLGYAEQRFDNCQD